jgi:hypothetical protein
MKYLYSLLFIICLSGVTRSQVNTYFNNNPCWTISSTQQIAQNCYTVDVYNYFINGDTVIGGYQYKQVFKKGYSYAQYYGMGPPPAGNPCLSPPPTYYYPAGLSFFIRSAGKKIYVRNASNMVCSSCYGDTLLYNFNLKVGDTLPKTMNNPLFSTFTVSAVDSIFTFNGWMKAFKLNSSSSYNFIEGMGYTNGLIEPMPIMLCNCGWSLGCYSQNTTAYYPSSGPSCLLSTSIKEEKVGNKPLVYPNPSTGKYQIYLHQFSINSRIEIYTITGQLINSFLPQSENVEINLSKEKDGIYFLNYISNGKTESVKLIKE